MLCWFLHSRKQISHNYTYIPFLMSLPPLPISHPSRSSQSANLGSLCYTGTSHHLFNLHMIGYIHWCYFSISPTLSFPPCVHKSVIYICNYEQLHANIMDKLEEMEKFLERYHLPRLNQEEIENMNRLVTSNEIESVMLRLPTNVQDHVASKVNYTEHLEKT